MTNKADIKDYGITLEYRKDKEENIVYRVPLFCIDCLWFKYCRGKRFRNCKFVKYALNQKAGT